jgi:hypothetical protein
VPALERLLDRAAVTAVLQQELLVRLENISGSGCLLTTPRPLRVGAVGCLRIVVDRVEYVGHVRIVRSETVDERSWNVGVELLWIPEADDVRDAAPAPRLNES